MTTLSITMSYVNDEAGVKQRLVVSSIPLNEKWEDASPAQKAMYVLDQQKELTDKYISFKVEEIDE